MTQEEDVLTYALYPQVAVEFLKGNLKEEPLEPPRDKAVQPLSIGPMEYRVGIENDVYLVMVEPVSDVVTDIKAVPRTSGPANVEGGVFSSMMGTVLKIKVSEGDEVAEGDVLAVIEAMKMENDVCSPRNGVVREIMVTEGDGVEAGDILMIIN